MKDDRRVTFPWMELGVACQFAGLIVLINAQDVLLSGSIIVVGWIVFFLDDRC